MIKLKIPDMSCAHCAGVITRTVKGIDQHAELAFEMAQQQVLVGTSAPLGDIVGALAEAGYPASVVP